MPLVNNKIVFFEVLPAVKFILNKEPPAVTLGVEEVFEVHNVGENNFIYLIPTSFKPVIHICCIPPPSLSPL